MRGVQITEPMTIRELAEACDLSTSRVRDYLNEGFLHVAPSPDGKRERPFKVLGFVPIRLEDCRRFLRDAIPGKTHMVGFVGETVHFIDPAEAEAREVRIRRHLEGLEEQATGLAGLYGVDDEQG